VHPHHSLQMVCTIVLAVGCGPSEMHVPATAPGSSHVQAPDGSPSAVVAGGVRLRASVCEGVDLRPDHRLLEAEEFIRFVRAQGLEVRVATDRGDLVYADVINAGTQNALRFRVAVLPDAGAAGRDLHLALLQHGSGAWGVHRANLAVLAPAGSLDDVVGFAARSKLACWGVLTVAGLDDTFVIPGGYTEL
jgi:hypothetical protein